MLSEAGTALTDGDKGDLVLSGGSTVWTIDVNVVSNTKLADMATATFKGRTTAGTGDPEDLTVTQATAMLSAVVGDSGAGGTKGLVPAPAAGDAAASKFLKADGTWTVVAAGAAALDDLTDVDAPTPSNGDMLTFDNASGDWIAAAPTGGGGSAGSDTAEWSMTVAASDETTDLTVGDSKLTFYMDTDVTLSEVFTSVSGQSSSGDVTIDIRKNGTTIFGTPPSIQASEDTSLTGTVATLSDTALSKGDKIEIDIDAAGTGASGLKVALIGEKAVSNSLGKHTVWIPASAMTPATTSGSSALAQVETATNDINVGVLDFDDAADEHAHFHIAFPKSWDLGTITFQTIWTSTAVGTTGVAWGLQGIALSDGDPHDTAWGTAVVVVDNAQSAADEILVSAESTAVTIGGTPAEGDVIFFRVFRDVSDAGDDMTEDARLIGLKVFYTIDAENDD